MQTRPHRSGHRLSKLILAYAMLALATRIVIPVVSINRCHADDFPEVYNNEADKDAEPMDASLAAKTMRLPAGFSATVFASEPDVRNPIAMAWDDRQRMWVAENYTYSDRTQHFDLALRDRVIILNDSDGDGHAEQRSVFLDNVQMLTSVEVGRGGVWLMCPPQLLFVPDANGDDVPDGPPEVVLDGFTVAQANYHTSRTGFVGDLTDGCTADAAIPAPARSDAQELRTINASRSMAASGDTIPNGKRSRC
ncbi:hypothetical protein C2E31_01995 [Rhodopirellula baltica]|nr:hypothetical protein C2E31_01995 [Rhodopirellula baltica]